MIRSGVPDLQSEIPDAMLELAAQERQPRPAGLGDAQPREHLGVVQREAADRGHDLRAVDEREAFLRRERKRLQSMPLERCARRGELALHMDLPDAEQRERKVRKRRQIARGADRALRGNAGIDAAVIELDEPLAEPALGDRVLAGEAG